MRAQILRFHVCQAIHVLQRCHIPSHVTAGKIWQTLIHFIENFSNLS